jgi:NADH:ubiquinone oxidoreductase subunit E
LLKGKQNFASNIYKKIKEEKSVFEEFAKENKEKIEQLFQAIESNKEVPGALMPVLQRAQEIFGYLPMEVQQIISEGLRISLAEVYGVATFYSQFNLEKQGEKKIGVCLGTACYVRGAQEIIDIIKDELNIKVNGTTDDGKFTLIATRCIGACGLAPVMTIGEDVYGRLKASEVASILKKY